MIQFLFFQSTQEFHIYLSLIKAIMLFQN